MDAFLLALFTACIWGVVPILEKLGLAKTEPITALFYRCIGVVIGLVLLGLFVVKPAQLKETNIKSVALLILSGFLASFAAQILFYNSLKIGDVSRVTPVSGSYPLIAFILGILILGEAVTWPKVAGAVLIVAGVWLLR